jgi:hypothetical protein
MGNWRSSNADLGGLARLDFCGKGAVAATKVVSAVFHKEGGEFGINAVG